jgi:hypothetical protein
VFQSVHTVTMRGPGPITATAAHFSSPPYSDLHPTRLPTHWV